MPITICRDEICTGCGACVAICKYGAIKINVDRYGYYRPIVYENKCIQCSMCTKLCPSKDYFHFYHPNKVLAASSFNTNALEQCASGGAADTISTIFLQRYNGIVYGTVILNNRVVFKSTDQILDLCAFRGSKYVSSTPGDSFAKIRQQLCAGRAVLFVGLPCQVAGLKKVVPKDLLENLFTIDLICHGAPSSEHLAEHLRYRYGKKSKIIRFRDQNGGFNIIVENKGKETQIPFGADLYMLGFINGYCYRPSCYQCKYAQHNRVGDITLGDFWGLETKNKLLFKNKYSSSLILINSEKGLKLCDGLEEYMNIEEHTLDEALKKNEQLCRPSHKSIEYLRFMAHLPKYGFEKSARKSWGRKTFRNYVFWRLSEIKKCLIKWR